MTIEKYATNLFNSRTASGGLIAGNSRGGIYKSGDGRIYVVIDGVKNYADRNDLFNMNGNPLGWFETFIKTQDLKLKKQEFNANNEERLGKITDKMEENDEAIEISREKQFDIEKIIKGLKLELDNFMKKHKVSSRSHLLGKQKEYADKLYKDIWANIFEKTSEGINEDRYLSSNFSLALEKGNEERQIAFNNFNLEKIYEIK